MAVRRAEVDNPRGDTMSAGTAIQAAVMALLLLLSPLFYDLWRALGGT